MRLFLSLCLSTIPFLGLARAATLVVDQKSAAADDSGPGTIRRRLRTSQPCGEFTGDLPGRRSCSK